MVGRTLDLNEIISPYKDSLAVLIATKYMEWEQARSPWSQQKQELRNYLFATDTTTTSNKTLPWKNSTTTPKLTQIRDNLHANYMQALFPSSDWLVWEGDGQEDELEKKRAAIESYMRTKLRQDNFEVIVSNFLLDWIDNGNCFGTAVWVDESVLGPDGEVLQRGYVGPRAIRLAWNDIVFNPVAASFTQSPKIVRALKSIGELVDEAEKKPKDSDEYKMMKKAIDIGLEIRRQVSSLSQGDSLKDEGFQMDGFSSARQYYGSDIVEVMTFYGDLYDVMNNKFYKNHQISILDRALLVSLKPNPNWTSHPGFFHAGWRQRPDNLYAMGPLDNLVGMQYRMDHLENLKADVFDQIALPMMKIKGLTDDFVHEPGARVYVGDDGDVAYIHPPHEALQADNQIQLLDQRMELMAGAPKEAMGIRSPGEKTKFEVQKLDNAASRIFQNKIEHFQKVFLEPLLNYMLQLARRNMSAADVARTLDSDIDAVIFSTITKDDIIANGILRPVGAEHFAEQANALQNLITILGSPVYADPAVQAHLSAKGLAKAITELGDLEKFRLYGDNIRIAEKAETARLANAQGEQIEIEHNTPADFTAGSPEEPMTKAVL